jgi:hypothetical protein
MTLECERWQWRVLLASEHGPTNPSTRLVLFVLSLHMNQVGDNAFPSQQLIAKRSGLSERSVRRHLALAEKAGWINVYQKSRKGQAWFVHEYVATIPDDLAQYCTSKPWEDDPQWQRADNSAGRSRDSKPNHPDNSAGCSDSGNADAMRDAERHPANCAQRAANLSERAAENGTTPGQRVSDARSGLPTNSSSNSSVNSPMNTPNEGAALMRNTGVVEILNARQKSEESKEVRLRKAAILVRSTPDIPNANVAKMYKLTETEVQQLRRTA